ncbi:MAG: type II secretion system F family protein [Micrococcales bacterium]
MASKPLFSRVQRGVTPNLDSETEVKWVVSYRDESGKKKSQQVLATSRARARGTFAGQNVEILGIKQWKPWWEAEFGAKPKPGILLQVTRQMSSFTQAGIPVLDALRLLADSSKSKPMAHALSAMVNDIRDGDTLAQAAKYHPTIFPEYYCAVLEAAQRSGDLAGTFDTLSKYLERDLAATRAIKSAMYYPIVLMSLGLVAVIILATYVLPKFQTIFEALGTDLPTPTVILIYTTNFVAAFWPVIIAAIVGIIVGFRAFRASRRGRYLTDLWLLKIPLLGPVVTLIALERFCRILSSLTSTGVPLTESLTITSNVLGNQAFAKAVISTRDGVISGRGLTEPMEASKMFPAETIQIFRVGEHSGLLGRQLGNAADYYAGEVDYRLKNITSLIEPVVLILVGGGTGFVAVALVSAMYGIFSNTGQ